MLFGNFGSLYGNGSSPLSGENLQGSGQWDEPTDAQLLTEIDAKWLFDYPFGVNVDHQRYLISEFYAQYGQRRIGHPVPGVFKQWVKARIMQIWAQQYAPLYASIFKVSLDNWDINFQTEKGLRRQHVRNNTGTFYGRDTEEAGSNGRISNARVSKEHSQEDGIDSRLSANDTQRTNSTTAATASKGWEQGQTDNLNTDTPQNKTLLGGFTPVWEQPGATDLDSDKGSGGNVEGESWNEGYLTSANRQNASGNTWGNTAAGQDSLDNAKEMAGTTGGYGKEGSVEAVGNSTQDSKNYRSQEGSKASINDSRDYGVEFVGQVTRGLTNIALSDMLVKYRATLIAVDRQFISEFWNMFLRIF